MIIIYYYGLEKGNVHASCVIGRIHASREEGNLYTKQEYRGAERNDALKYP